MDYITGVICGHDAQRGREPEEEKARFSVSREFAKRVKQLLGDAPDIVFEHVGKTIFPTSVFTAKTFGKS